MGSGLDSAFPYLFGAAVVAIVGVWILMAVRIVRSRRVLRRAGIDPGTAEAQLAVRFLHGPGSAGAPSPVGVDERLAQLDDLQRRGLITSEEHRLQRGRILGSL